MLIRFSLGIYLQQKPVRMRLSFVYVALLKNKNLASDIYQRLHVEVFSTSKPGVQTNNAYATASQGMCASLTDAAGRSGRTGVGARYKLAGLTSLNNTL